MSSVSRSTFKNNTTVLYPDNITGEISAADLRAQMDDVADSTVFIITSTSNPTAGDDTSNVGDIWVNTNTNIVYICVDNSSGAAIWQEDAATLGHNMELTGTFDFDTSTSNPNTPFSDVYEYHKPLTGPWFQSFEVTGELGEDKHLNPKYQWGLVPFGGIGEPMIALYYEDDGDDRQGMLDRGEITQAQLDAKPADTFDTDNRFGNRSKPIFITEPGGTFATVRDRAGSHYEGFMRDSHTSDASGGPSFRIGSQSGGGKRGAYVELGDGKGVECDFRISRPEGNVIDIRTNNADKMKIHNNLGWRRGLALLDGMGLYFQDDGTEVIETFTAAADGDQDFTIAQSLSGSYSIVEVQVDGDGVDPSAINVSGQVLTITPHEYTDPTSGANYGHDVLAGDTVRVRMSNPQGTVLRMRGQWDGSKTIVNLDGTMKVNDIVNQSGQSAFTSGGSGGTTAYFEVTQSAQQTFTANTYAVIDFQNSSGTAGWDAINNYYVVPAAANNTYAHLVVSMKADGSVGSNHTMILELQYSTNNGINWVNISQSANVDFYGNQSLAGLKEVSTGDLIRARARFSTGRDSAGNSSVKMSVRFAP